MGKTELFIELLTRYQQRILLFILSLVPNQSDAEEVLQETTMVLWRKFDEFEPGTNFRAWAFRIAYLKVQKYWERKSHDRLRFDEEFLQRVAAVAGSMPDTVDKRQEALAGCLKKLPEKDQDLVQCRYQPHGSVQATAEKLGRSTHAIYKALARVRRRLHECVRLTLAAEKGV